jgi:hypothetical protein
MSPAKPQRTVQERAMRKERVQAVTTALKESSALPGPHVPAARAALRSYLRRLDEPDQPSDGVFQQLLAAPFASPRPPRR